MTNGGTTIYAVQVHNGAGKLIVAYPAAGFTVSVRRYRELRRVYGRGPRAYAVSILRCERIGS